MANLTKAQRHNRMMDEVFNTYRQQEESKRDFLPTISAYSHFLDEAEKRFKITRDKARNKYGLYTYGQWKELLNLF